MTLSLEKIVVSHLGVLSVNPAIGKNFPKRAGDVITQRILIEDGCWIGANVTIILGVTIQKGA